MNRWPRSADRRVFADTSAYFSFFDPRSSNHAEARALMRRLTDERWRMFTTNFIVAELHALVLARRGRELASYVLSILDRAPATTIIRVTEDDEREARAIIRRYADKDFSLTDALSFAVMQRLRIPAAFTFDDDFRQFGVTVLAAG